MPVIRIIPGREAPQKISQYIRDEEKTDERYIFASDCDPDNPEWDFQIQEKKHHKNQLRKYYHIIISYNTVLEKIPPEKIIAMVKELCDSTVIKNYPYFGAIHYKDRPDHLHCHLVVSNIASRTNREEHIKEGRHFKSSQELRKELMEKANAICLKHGYLRSIILPENKARERLTQAEIALFVKGVMPWKETLRLYIDIAREKSYSISEFKNYMYENYRIMVQENKKGQYRYIPEIYSSDKAGEMKPCSQRRLGEDFGKEFIEKDIKERLSQKYQMEVEKAKDRAYGREEKRYVYRV